MVNEAGKPLNMLSIKKILFMRTAFKLQKPYNRGTTWHETHGWYHDHFTQAKQSLVINIPKEIEITKVSSTLNLPNYEIKGRKYPIQK